MKLKLIFGLFFSFLCFTGKAQNNSTPKLEMTKVKKKDNWMYGFSKGGKEVIKPKYSKNEGIYKNYYLMEYPKAQKYGLVDTTTGVEEIINRRWLVICGDKLCQKEDNGTTSVLNVNYFEKTSDEKKPIWANEPNIYFKNKSNSTGAGNLELYYKDKFIKSYTHIGIYHGKGEEQRPIARYDDWTTCRTDSVICVRTATGMGMINRRGEEVLPCMYGDIRGFKRWDGDIKKCGISEAAACYTLIKPANAGYSEDKLSFINGEGKITIKNKKEIYAEPVAATGLNASYVDLYNNAMIIDDEHFIVLCEVTTEKAGYQKSKSGLIDAITGKVIVTEKYNIIKSNFTNASDIIEAIDYPTEYSRDMVTHYFNYKGETISKPKQELIKTNDYFAYQREKARQKREEKEKREKEEKNQPQKEATTNKEPCVTCPVCDGAGRYRPDKITIYEDTKGDLQRKDEGKSLNYVHCSKCDGRGKLTQKCAESKTEGVYVNRNCKCD